jgi:hypothetical protein
MEPSVRRPAINLLVLIAALMPSASPAFESEEHEKLGNVAFIAALAYFRQTHPDRKSEHEEAARLIGRPGADRSRSGELSYGDVIACVDYFLHPERLLAEPWRAGRSSARPGGLPRPDENLLDLVSCRGMGNAFFQATHHNQSHFQYDALMSYRLYHLAAIAIARDEKSLFAALVTNAIADHYLHDFFAPGHVFTARDQLTDVPATALHDIRNDLGATFLPANFESLRPFVEFICQGSVESCRVRTGLHLETIAGDASGAQVGQALQAILEGKPLHLKGDARLWEPGADRLRQRLMMFLVQTRSILDVLTGRNSFQEMVWEGGAAPTRASIGFGDYVQPTDAPQLWTNPIVGISLQREALIAGARSGRSVIAVETPAAVWRFEKFIVLPLIGYASHFEGNVNGQGPTFRLVSAIPQTELAFGPYLRYLAYPSDEGDKRRVSFGLRMDSGFSGYFTTFVAVGRDTATTTDGKLRAGIIFAAGLQFSFPVSRIPR